MTSFPARVWRKFTSAAPNTTNPAKIGSAKWNDDLNVFLGTVCDALSKLDTSADMLAYFTSASSAQLTAFTAFARLLVAAETDTAARALLSALNKAGDTMTGDLNMGLHKVTGLPAPSGSSDAATKAYVDALATLVSGALTFQTGWDASTGAFPAANFRVGGAVKVGNFWKVTVAGTVGGQSFSVGDDIFAVVDSPSTSTYAANWLVIQGTLTLAEIQAAVGFTFGSLAAQSSITAAQISDASANGRSLIKAADYAAMKVLLAIAAADVSGLGTAATLNVGTGANNIPQLDASSRLPPVDGSQLTNLPVSGLADIERRNILLTRIFEAKLLGSIRRHLSAVADGFAASDGINVGASANYSVNTGSKYLGPTFPPAAVSGATGTNIGNYTDGGGLAAAFDGTNSKAEASCARRNADDAVGYIGKSYSPAKKISKVELYPAADQGFISGATYGMTWNLYAKNGAAPSGPTDGTLIGTLTLGADTTAMQSITSTDQVTAFDHVWVHNIQSPGWKDLSQMAIYEVGAANNVTLVTATRTADASVSNARVLIEYDASASPTLNTDLTVEVTCNGGTNWATATLALAGTVAGGRKVAETGLTACIAGTSFAARIKAFNNKNVPIYGVTVTAN